MDHSDAHNAGLDRRHHHHDDQSGSSRHDEEQPLLGKSGAGIYHIDILPSIYTAAVYAPFVTRIKTGKHMSKAIVIIWAMLFLNMVLQLGMLHVINLFSHHDAASRHLIDSGRQPVNNAAAKTYKQFLLPHERVVLEDGETDALCTLNNGVYSCMPSGVEFASEWKSLDTDGDGVWTLAEASAVENAQGNLTSLLQSDKTPSAQDEAIERRRALFFNSIITGLKQRAEWMAPLNGTLTPWLHGAGEATLYLTQDVLAGQAIPKPYFDYWVGDAMMCSRFDSLACTKIVASGLFDEALTKGRFAAAHKGVFDYTSATKYCTMMLEDHGGCEQSLPSEFMLAKMERQHVCGEATLHSDGVIADPNNPTEVMSVAKPSYTYLDARELAQHGTFLFFTVLILIMFYSSLVVELRDVIKLTDFLYSFPACQNPQDSGGVDLGEGAPDGKRYHIERISPRHRVAIAVIVVMRTVIFVVVAGFGTWFLLVEDNYMELVLNAVALSFIVTVDEVIYDVFVETKTKADVGCDETERISYTGVLPRDDGRIAGYLMRKDVWGLIVLPIISTVVVLCHMHFVREPGTTALTCACLQEGQNCAESMLNQEGWWQQYWSHTLPAAIHQIEALRVQGM